MTAPGEERAGRWRRARRVLCVRLDTIGDVLMTTPALRALKQAAPGRSITLLTSSRGAEVAGLVPEIDEVIVYDAPWMKATSSREDSRADQQMLRLLRGGRFDAAAIFTVYSQNPMPAALLCYLADIPLRLSHCRENPYQLLTDWVRETEPEAGQRHEVQRQLDLVAPTGATVAHDSLSLRVPAPARKRVLELLKELGVDARRQWVVVHPGASAESRRYMPEGFAKAGRTLVKEYGWQVVLSGTGSERELIDAVMDEMRASGVSLAGRLSLAELSALIAEAPLLISNNTAPVHIASAVGTPVVDLYALTNPQHTPWRVPSRTLFHDVPCKNCYRSVCPEGHHNCLRLVPPAAVVHAALDLAREAGGRRARGEAARERTAAPLEEAANPAGYP